MVGEGGKKRVDLRRWNRKSQRRRKGTRREGNERLQDEWLTELIVRFGLLPKLNATGLVHMGQYQARYPRNTFQRSRITVNERYRAVLLNYWENENDMRTLALHHPDQAKPNQNRGRRQHRKCQQRRTPSLEPWLESSLELELSGGLSATWRPLAEPPDWLRISISAAL